MPSIDFNYKSPPTITKFMLSDSFHRAVKGPIGCTSADTEFLTPHGWKRIDQFTDGDLVGQCSRDGRLSFCRPEEYVVRPCEELIWFKGSTVSMQLSEEHRVPLYDWRGKFVIKTAAAVEKSEAAYRIPTTFTPAWEDATVSDNRIRLAVVINEEVFHYRRGFHTSTWVGKGTPDHICQLLEANGVTYSVSDCVGGGRRVDFISPYQGNGYGGWIWRQLSRRQLRVVIDEFIYLKGIMSTDSVELRSTTRQDADFIQYAVHAIGGRASIVEESVGGAPAATTHVIDVAMPHSSEAVCTINKNDMDVGRVRTTDGKKYCFSVPTGLFLARHNGFVFVTGNSGKSVGMCVEILRRNLEMPKWNNGKRSSRWAIVRNTSKELRNTTLETWMKWMWRLGMWRESKARFELKFGDVDSQILFLPLDTPGDIGRLLSLELTGIWINEAREVPLSLLADAKGRLGRYPAEGDRPDNFSDKMWTDAEGNNHWYWTGMICDTNPPEEESEWYKLFEKLPQDEDDPSSIIDCEVFSQPSGLAPDAENIEHLRKGYYKNLMNQATQTWINTYIHGMYSPSMTGKPVYYKVFKRERHVASSPLPVDSMLPVVISFDTGLTPAATFKQMTLDGRIHVLREAVEFDMGMQRFATMRLRPIIKNFFPDNPLIFIGDPAGKRRADSDESSAFKMLKEEFSADGAIIKAAATNDPKVRIQATEQMLSRYPDGEPLMVVDPSCKWYIEALRSKYRYPKIKQSGNYSDKPEKNKWSHIAEAGQYGDMYLLSGKYNPSDHTRVTSREGDPFSNVETYRPAQQEGY